MTNFACFRIGYGAVITNTSGNVAEINLIKSHASENLETMLAGLKSDGQQLAIKNAKIILHSVSEQHFHNRYGVIKLNEDGVFTDPTESTLENDLFGILDAAMSKPFVFKQIGDVESRVTLLKADDSPKYTSFIMRDITGIIRRLSKQIEKVSGEDPTILLVAVTYTEDTGVSVAGDGVLLIEYETITKPQRI